MKTDSEWIEELRVRVHDLETENSQRKDRLASFEVEFRRLELDVDEARNIAATKVSDNHVHLDVPHHTHGFSAF